MKDLITIFNYNDNINYNIMFKTWLIQATKFSVGFNIKVLSRNEPNEYIKKLKEDYDFTWIVEKDYEGNLDKFGPYKKHHNLTFKMFNISKNENPFIYIDVDAFILSDLNDIWKYSKDKPFIGINHQIIPLHTENEKEPFLNSGVLLVSDPSFIDYNKIINEWNGMLCKGCDQAILYTHFKKNNYDYTHPQVGYEWNSCAGYSKLYKENDKWVAKTHNLKHHNHSVYINHYWDVFKPWKLNCPLFNEIKNM